SVQSWAAGRKQKCVPLFRDAFLYCSKMIGLFLSVVLAVLLLLLRAGLVMRLVLRSRRIGLRARLVSARGLAAVVISISPVPVVVIVISPVAAVVIIVVGFLVAVFISVAIARYGFLSRFTAILI